MSLTGARRFVKSTSCNRARSGTDIHSATAPTSVHCRSRLLPALVRALLRSPPALRLVTVSHSPLRPAVRSIATAAPIRRRHRDGVDLPHRSYSSVSTDLTARGGLGFHSPRIGDAGRAMEPYVLPFRRHSGSIGAVRLLDRAYVGPKLADHHRPVPARPRLSCRETRGCPERNTSETRATCACCGRGRHDWHPLSVNETRAQCAGFWDVRPGYARPGARPAQSGASPRSDSWNARASATSASSSFWRPSRSIASRLSVARNQV